MKSWLTTLVASVLCLLIGFCAGRFLGEESDCTSVCASQAGELLKTVEEREKQFRRLEKQSDEFARIAKTAIEQRDAIKRTCAMEYAIENSAEDVPIEKNELDALPNLGIKKNPGQGGER